MGINFRSLDKSKHFAGTNFRDFVRKPQKLVPVKISTINVAKVGRKPLQAHGNDINLFIQNVIKN